MQRRKGKLGPVMHEESEQVRKPERSTEVEMGRLSFIL